MSADEFTRGSKSARPGGSGVGPPIVWYRVSIAVLVTGLILAMVFGRLADFVLLVVTGRIMNHDVAEFALTVVLLAVSFLPLHFTVLWARRAADRATNPIRYSTSLRNIVIATFSRGRSRLAEKVAGSAFGRVGDPLPTAMVVTVLVGVVLVGFDGERALRDAFLIGLISLLAGSATYCLQRARDYTQVTSGRLGLFSTPLSARPADYVGVGRRWFIAAAILSMGWGALAVLFFFSRTS